jgi:hypothetical protein
LIEEVERMATGPSGEPERRSAIKALAVVCTWALVGIMLAGAAIWFGLEVFGEPL